MKTHIEKSIVCILLVLFANSGCSDVPSGPQATTNGRPKHVVKAKSVGEYQIGQSTLEEVLGSDTPDNRKRFSDIGLNFEFNSGKELTGVTVTVSDYALENGLTIGSSSSDVINKLGEPRKKKIELQPKGIELDALVYDDFVFLLDDSKNVAGIRIGN